MKKETKYSMMTGLIALVIGMVSFFVILNFYPTSYSGQEVFNTEEEYSQFKQELVDLNAKFKVGHMFVLSSKPPIIVKFDDIRVSEDISFPYGEKDSSLPPAVGFGVVISVCTVIFCILIKCE